MSNSKPKVHFLIIDPQHSFCDPAGSLFVTGADGDMIRLGEAIRSLAHLVDDVHVTLDNHQLNHIAHPSRWRGKNGKPPAPFTEINPASLAAHGGEWRASNPALERLQVAYVQALYANKRYPLIIWPPHCLIGSVGATIVPPVATGLDYWAETRLATVDYVPKGTNPNTEHYSGVVADVQDPNDPTTHVNVRLINALEEADIILFAGEASSHCVANTCADVIDNFAKPEYASKLVLLEDCMSPVNGLGFLYDNFKAKYGSRLRFATAAEMVSEIR
jgi:nicotinamidase/pyrazinamidase